MSEPISADREAALLIEFTDTEARAFTAARGQWFLLDVSGVSESEIAELADGEDADIFCRRNRGSLVAHITIEDGRAVRLDAWRGLMSQADLYYAVRPSGAVVASDHLRNVMVRLPVADRLPSERAVVEHHMSRRITSRETISAAVTRLGHAEHLSIDLRSGTMSSAIFDRFSAPVERRTTEEYLDMIDAGLEASLRLENGDESTAVLFSGGVDSALLMSYLRGRADAVTFVPDTPEFAEETAYARQAAAMLDISIIEVPMAEAGFLQMFEEATELMATPSFDDSVPYFARLVQSQPHSRFIAGQGADSAFGMSLKIARFASWFRNRRVSPLLSATAKRMPGHLGYRMRQVAPLAERFGRPLLDPFGFAGAYRTSASIPTLRRFVDHELIEAVNRDHLNYVTDRVELVADPANPLFSHIELAHWSILLTNPMMPSHASAKSAGKVMVGPFNSPGLLEMLATIPPEDRYLRRLSAKWILKDLLGRRLPEYSTNRRKKSTALPWQRFYEQGPLTGFWDKYDIPAIFDGALAEELISIPSPTTWTAMSYAVWERRVARNEQLAPHAATVAASYPIEPTRGS